jgi:hypothetical protein
LLSAGRADVLARQISPGGALENEGEMLAGLFTFVLLPSPSQFFGVASLHIHHMLSFVKRLWLRGGGYVTGRTFFQVRLIRNFT